MCFQPTSYVIETRSKRMKPFPGNSTAPLDGAQEYLQECKDTQCTCEVKFPMSVSQLKSLPDIQRGKNATHNVETA